MKQPKKRFKPALNLEEEEIKFYKLMLDWLEDQKDLQAVDTYILSLAAKSWAMVQSSLEELKENKRVQVFKNGTMQVSPYFTVYRQCVAEFQTHVRNLGLSPLARKSLLARIEPEKQIDDPLDKLSPGPARG